MSEDKAPPSVIPPSDPRSRALRHMRKLLQAAAFGGAALGLSACPPIVCDPLPPPLQCDKPDTFGNNFSATASWVSSDGGAPAVSVDVTTSYAGTEGRVRLNAPPQLDGGTLISSSDGGTKLEFTFAPNQGATRVVATIAGICEGTAGSARLDFDVTGGRDAGAAVPYIRSAP